MSYDSTFEAKLTAERIKIEADLSAIATYNAITDDWEAVPAVDELGMADEGDEADGIETWQERRATAALLERRYHNIKRALEKLRNGTFGVCEISGEAIEPDRLAANPAARTCKAHRDEEEVLPY